MDTKSQLEGPAGYNGGNGPGGALKMPTKHYPASGDLAKHPGKETNIDSPAPKDGYCHK